MFNSMLKAGIGRPFLGPPKASPPLPSPSLFFLLPLSPCTDISFVAGPPVTHSMALNILLVIRGVGMGQQLWIKCAKSVKYSGVWVFPKVRLTKDNCLSRRIFLSPGKATSANQATFL